MGSVLHAIAEESDKASAQVYKKLVTNVVPPEFEKVAKPKSSKQVANKQYNSRRNYDIDECEITSVLQMNNEIGRFVKHLSLLPSLKIILINNELASLWASMAADEGVSTLSIDTTYNLGDFYVTTVVGRHRYFEREPAFSVACLLHHRRDSSSHETLLKELKNKCPIINSCKVAMISDRERSIIKAIDTELPMAYKFVCWNHIFQDIKHWLKKNGGTSHDKTAYRSYILELLESKSDTEYEDRYEKAKLEWTQTFINYFDANLKDTIKKNHQGKLLDKNLYIQGSGITINISESMSAMYKRLSQYKELSIDKMTLAFYHLTCFYLHEINRGYRNIGDWVVKVMHKSKIIAKETPTLAIGSNSPEEIVKIVKNKQKLVKVSKKGIKSWHTTKERMAKFLVNDGRVHLDCKTGTFLVDGFNKKRQAVLLNPPSCSCSVDKCCIHILAARMSIRQDTPVPKKPSFTLSY